MKRKYTYHVNNKKISREIKYIPFRYILAMFLTILEILSIMAAVILLAIYVPYFYLLILLTVVGVVISIIASNDNPDYKVPWLLFVIVLPITGFMLYFLFYKRKLPKKMLNRIEQFNSSLIINDESTHLDLKKEDELVSTQALQLCKISNTHLYKDSKTAYYKCGEEFHEALINEIQKAKKFIFLEYFIIEEGMFWDSILKILKEKALKGVEVKVVYDDIGCMMTLPSNYYKKLKKYNINSVPFSKLKGQADGEFNNRSHRKILVVDGKVGFVGGINLADEYINKIQKFGYWKDSALKIEGNAVNELTKLFLIDYYSNDKKAEINFEKYYYFYEESKLENYIVPFGDGPKPIYEYNVGKTVIMNMLNQAKRYVYITTPYLIVDNEMLKAIENSALRGVEIKIVVPHIPDKKLVFEMTKSTYRLLMKKGVKIYEFEKGFIHAKTYISDDKIAMIGTINLDYRSLIHHFENGIWMYNDPTIMDMKKDFDDTIKESLYMNDIYFKDNLLSKFIRSVVRIFAPLL